MGLFECSECNIGRVFGVSGGEEVCAGGALGV